MTEETARQPVREFMKGRLTHDQWVKFFYKRFQSHVGELMAIKAMLVRKKIEETR
jgi:hypothetical protein